MAVISTTAKVYYRYTATEGNESTNRTISGINASSSGDITFGPNPTIATTNLFNTLISFSDATFSGVKRVLESEVSL